MPVTWNVKDIDLSENSIELYWGFGRMVGHPGITQFWDYFRIGGDTSRMSTHSYRLSTMKVQGKNAQ
jgi:hypothetical protein